MVRKKCYIPNRGDIVWINFNPQKGHEQAKKRPALVISSKTYNEKTSLALMCPITSHIKGYPFEVTIKEKVVSGVVLSDQIRCLDWHARKISFIQRVKPSIVSKVQEKILILITQ